MVTAVNTAADSKVNGEGTMGGSQDTGKKVLCPSCGEECRLLVSKKGRFLFLCKGCGLQCFSRGKVSEKWFGGLIMKETLR